MIINPKLIELLEKTFPNADDFETAITYAACVELGTIMTLYRWGIFKNDQDEHKYRILLCAENPDNDTIARKYMLRIPLWIQEVEDDLWDDFYKWLVKNPKLTLYKGRFSSTTEGKKAFEELSSEKGFDLNRFKDSVSSYYLREGQYAKALPKFLMENARGEYEGFVQVKSKLI